MRLGGRLIRQVKLERHGLSLHVSVRLICSQPCSGDGRWSIPRDQNSARRSSASFYDYQENSAISLPELQIPEASRPTRSPLQKASAPLVHESTIFQKWRSLVTDPARLLVESDFAREGPAKNLKGPLLVNKSENRTDMALWGCLLDFQTRINGPAGVVKIWKGLWGRKALYHVDGPLAEMFWRVILDGILASDDPHLLEGVWLYSEWMFDLHGVRWPHLYATIITHMLRTHQYRQVLPWALRLTPNFYPGPDEFGKIITRFASDRALNETGTLESLYKMNCDHKLYNTLLPHLYNLGESEMARKWRRLCIQYGDLPLENSAVTPFLRFLQAYHWQDDEDHLSPVEAAVLQAGPQHAAGTGPKLSREAVNIIYGETFGISPKNYNDRLGAKWLASRWVSLDTAVSALSALGVQRIGPLSLQSIGLRAGSAEELANRISQLEEQHIHIEQSNYVELVRYLVRQKDDELLQNLLESDFHPDVFDDVDLQTRLLSSGTGSSECLNHQLLLVARIVVFHRSAQDIANSIFRLRFHNRDRDGVRRILEDMKSRNLMLNPAEVERVHDSIAEDYEAGEKGLSLPLTMFYLAVLRQLGMMGIPAPLSSWRLLLINMAQNGGFNELDKLCVGLIDAFFKPSPPRLGFVPVHVADVPQAMRDPRWHVREQQAIHIPQDLPVDLETHPLRLLFNEELIAHMIQSAFVAALGQGYVTRHGKRYHPFETQAIRIRTVLRTLRVLYNRVPLVDVKVLQCILTDCLVQLYAREKAPTTKVKKMRARNTLTLSEMKQVIDEAWGGNLLPSVTVLRETIQKGSAASQGPECDKGI
ncbi:hypothetical protein GGS20DRAFT_563365 [Poronia punctata]|nr:hypothetical protein GGS20DRAFT_563365 [Poronia punctata]